jgi:hypothetical protein
MALNNLTLEGLQILLDHLHDLKMDEISHKLCLIRRQTNNVESGFLVVPITDDIQSELVTCIQNSNMHQLLKTYKKLFYIPSVRGFCGIVFETICHRRFQKPFVINYMPMVRLASGRWHSSHHPFENQEELEKLREVVSVTTVEVHPSTARVYEGQELDPEPGIYYYIPRKSNQVALDSFILYETIFYMFQFTVSEAHSINDGLISQFAERVKLPPMDKWRFIFIISDNVKLLECPYPKSPTLQRLVPSSAQIVLEDPAEPVAPPESDESELTIPKKRKLTRCCERVERW